MLGTLVSMSVVQGGSGLPILLPVVFEYISIGQCDPHHLTETNMSDYVVRSLLTDVC